MKMYAGAEQGGIIPTLLPPLLVDETPVMVVKEEASKIEHGFMIHKSKGIKLVPDVSA